MVSFASGAFASDPISGFPPYGSFEDGKFDAINRENLNVNLSIPLTVSLGRGVDLRQTITYDTLIWKKGGYGWTSVTDQDGSPTWGWKMNSPVGTIKYGTDTEYCDIVQPPTHTIHYYGYSYIDPVGTLHPFSVDFYVATTRCNFNTGPRTGYATDGSGYYLDATTLNAPFVRSPSGVKIEYNGTLTDPNGNYISKVVVSSSETDWKDTVGRTALKIIKASDYADYKWLDVNGTYETTTLHLQTLNIKTNFACPSIPEYTGTASLPISVVLPNSQQYSFTYEPTPGFPDYYTGRVKRITLPTGGYYEYQYPTTPNNGINCADAKVNSLTRVINDGSASATWQFARTQVAPNWKTTVTAPQLPYDSASNVSEFVFTSGKETSRKFYQGSSTLLRTVNTTYAANGTPSAITTILENNQQSKVEPTFDTYGNLTQLIAYGWGAGAPGSAVRTTNRTFLSTSAYTALNIRDRLTQEIIRDGGPSASIRLRTDIAYDAGGLTCVTGALQHNDSAYGCSYTTRGNPTSVTGYTNATAPSGAIAKNFSYDSVGNLRQADVNCCQQEQWTYTVTTQWAYPDSVTRGVGSSQVTTGATYNSSTGLISTTTDENAKATTFSYDTLKRLTDIQRPDDAHITYSYDDSAKTVTVHSPIEGTNERREITAYDGLGRPFRRTVADGSSATYSIVDTQYDALSRPYEVSNPYTASAQYWTETRFDALGRPLKIILPGGSPSSNNTSYSYAGSAVTMTDPAGKLRKLDYDALGRLASATEPDDGGSLNLQTSYTYSVLDALRIVTQGSQTRTYSYDDMGRLTSVATPETNNVATNYQYNNFNLMTQRTDPRGVITNYGYDGLNRLSQITYNVGSTGVPATPTVGFTYGTDQALNNKGRLLAMTDGLGSETYGYDILGRVTQVQKMVSGTPYTTIYDYNLAGELKTLTHPSGRLVQQSYNTVGRLTSVASGGTNYASGYGYNPAGRLTAFNYGNGVAASFGYSSDRLQLQSLSYVKGKQTLFSLGYDYTQPNGGNNGAITSITDLVDGGRTVSYTYDTKARLGSAVTNGSTNYPKWGLSWTYDRYANRSAQTVTYDSPPSNAVTPSPTTNRFMDTGYAYDANGNMTDDGPNNTITYDAENRIVSLSPFSGGTASYSYDGKNLRVKKVFGGTTTVYIFSGSKVIAEYTNGSLAREYIYSGGNLLATIEGATTKYYHADHLSVRLTTDPSGTKIGEQGHYPFGESWYASGTTTQWQFTSYERDTESNNDYAMARSHINRFGRFSSPDPLAGDVTNPQSLNRYAYVLNNPTNLTDPQGLKIPWDEPRGADLYAGGGLGGAWGPCTIDGLDSSCSSAYGMLASGAGVEGPVVTVRVNPATGTGDFFRSEYGGYTGWSQVYIQPTGLNTDACNNLEGRDKATCYVKEAGLLEDNRIDWSQPITWTGKGFSLTLSGEGYSWLEGQAALGNSYASNFFGWMHAGDLGVSVFGVQDFRGYSSSGSWQSMQVTANRSSYYSWMDVDRFNPALGLIPMLAHLFGEVLPGL